MPGITGVLDCVWLVHYYGWIQPRGFVYVQQTLCLLSHILRTRFFLGVLFCFPVVAL